MIILCFYRP